MTIRDLPATVEIDRLESLGYGEDTWYLSDCQICTHYRYEGTGAGKRGHTCDGEPCRHNIYVEACPTPEKKDCRHIKGQQRLPV